jgi:hypothetical protein
VITALGAVAGVDAGAQADNKISNIEAVMKMVIPYFFIATNLLD